MASLFDTFKNNIGTVINPGIAVGNAIVGGATQLGNYLGEKYYNSPGSRGSFINPLPPQQTAIRRPSSGGSGSNIADDLRREFAANNASLANLLRPQASPLAPAFDVLGNLTRARQQAEAAVSPLYVKKLNDFLEQQRVLRDRKVADTERLKKEADEALANSLESTGIDRTRTSEDVANELSQIGTNEDNFQTDSAGGFDEARTALLGNIATSGLTTSGLGRQQEQKAIAGKRTEEGRQVESFNVQKKAQETFRTRTFEDLLRSDKLNTKKTEQTKELAKIDLDRYIEDLSFTERDTRSKLEGERLGAIVQQQGDYSRLGFENFLATLRDPAQIQLARQVYGGSI